MPNDGSKARQFAVAVKSSARGSVQSDWHKLLAAIPGVRVLGVSPNHAQVQATPEAAEALRNKLGNDFLIEEDQERYPA